VQRYVWSNESAISEVNAASRSGRTSLQEWTGGAGIRRRKKEAAQPVEKNNHFS